MNYPGVHRKSLPEVCKRRSGPPWLAQPQLEPYFPRSCKSYLRVECSCTSFQIFSHLMAPCLKDAALFLTLRFNALVRGFWADMMRHLSGPRKLSKWER